MNLKKLIKNLNKRIIDINIIKITFNPNINKLIRKNIIFKKKRK